VPNQSDDDEENIGNQIEEIETIISKEVSKDLRDKIVKNFETLTNTDGTQNVNGMWTLKRKIFPKHVKPLPVAKKNLDGRLVTSQQELKELYFGTFKHRIRHRPMKDDLKELEKLEEELCSKRLKLSKMNKSKEWDMEKLKKILSKLKNNKSRDPHGFINEPFKPGVCGARVNNTSFFQAIQYQYNTRTPVLQYNTNLIPMQY
jgi:hypothetical protein